MNLRYLVSAVGLGVMALLLAGSALRASVRPRVATEEPRLLAYSRISAAIGCGTLGASYAFTGRLMTILLLVPAVAGLVMSIVLESVRRRRIARV